MKYLNNLLNFYNENKYFYMKIKLNIIFRNISCKKVFTRNIYEKNKLNVYIQFLIFDIIYYKSN